MSAVGIPHAVLREVIKGVRNPQFESLALKMLLVRLRMVAQMDPSAATLEKSVAEMQELFQKNAALPSIQRDMAKL